MDSDNYAFKIDSVENVYIFLRRVCVKDELQKLQESNISAY